MIQRDYILRLIDQLGALLRALLGSGGDVKRPEKPISHAAQLDVALEKSCQEAIGLSFRTINEMRPDNLMELLRSGGATWVSRCFFVGRVFEFGAEIARHIKQGERAKEKRICGKGPLFLQLFVLESGGAGRIPDRRAI